MCRRWGIWGSFLLLFGILTQAALVIRGSGIPSAVSLMELFSPRSGVVPSSLPHILYDGHVGSKGALYQLENRRVDFILSWIPLSSRRLRALDAVQFPLAIGALVPIVNIAGIGDGTFALDGAILYGILTGQISFWDDPRIVAINPRERLPHQQIMLVYPNQGSSATYILSHFMQTITSDWLNKSSVGYNVAWPSAGVTGVAYEPQSFLNPLSFVGRIPNSLGFVDYVRLLRGTGDRKHQKHFAGVLMQNARRNIIAPGFGTFVEAASYGNYASSKDYETFIDNMPGRRAWPLAATLFIAVPLGRKQAGVTLSFFMWLLKYADMRVWQRFGYSPIPAPLQVSINRYIVKRLSTHNRRHPRRILRLSSKLVSVKLVSEVYLPRKTRK